MLLLLLLCGCGALYAEHLTCVICEPGTYCYNDQLLLCPEHATSHTGSDNIMHCVCLSGYYQEPDSHSCLPCLAGSYCENEAQYSCPEHTTSLELSGSSSNCICLPGYTGSPCEACVAGTFKSVNGSVACEFCPENTFSTVQAAIDVSVCEDCPAHSHAVAGSDSITDCVCDEGYESFGTDCVPICNANSARLVAGGSCLCSAGFTGADGVAPDYTTSCTACPAGTFKATNGSEACQPCEANSYNPDTAAQSCLDCTANAVSDSGASSVTECLCMPAYTLVDGSCVLCSGGFFKNTTSNQECSVCEVGTFSEGGVTACSECLSNTYQNEKGQSSCKACSTNSVSAAGSDDCECVPGYSAHCEGCASGALLNGTCELCLTGYYKSDTGNEPCTACDSGRVTLNPSSTYLENCTVCFGFTTETMTGRICSSCPANSLANAGAADISACQCDAGYTGLITQAGDSCVECEAGKYKSSLGSAACSACPLGMIGIANASLRDTVANSCAQCPIDTYSSSLTVCTDCPQHTVAPVQSGDASACVCDVGYTLNNGNCEVCVAGYVKAVTGNQACDICGAGTYELDNVCVSCPNNTNSAAGSFVITSCVCNAGFTGDDGTDCVSCSAGTYKPSTGSSACITCGENTYYSGDAPYVTDQCTICPGNSSSTAMSSSLSDCTCNAGFIRSAVDRCLLCTEGFYCVNQYSMVACSSGSSSAAGSTNSNDCTCSAGFFGPANTCTRCPVNSYCPGGESNVSCPAHSTTLGIGGQTNVSGCVCDAGYYETILDGNVGCEQCPVDSFCANDIRITCPANSSSRPGQDSIADCFCDEYFTKDVTGNFCFECSNKFVCHASDGFSEGIVQQCKGTSVNVNQHCVCPLGSFCDEGNSNASCSGFADTCNDCPVGFYCNSNMKMSCDVNSTSPANSSSVLNCTCLPGYYRSTTGQCLLCPIGSYCSDETQVYCKSFDSHLTTPSPGQDERTDCICELGFFRQNALDSCKLCPKDFYCASETITELPNVVACQLNAMTHNRGSDEKSDCFCNAGFLLTYDAATPMLCVECAPGERCAGGDVEPELCHLENRMPSADHTSCICGVGFEEDVNFQCSACQPGYFKDTTGNQACSLCPDGTVWVNSSSCVPCRDFASSSPDRLSCNCDAPRTLFGDTCVLCEENHYYDAGICVSCPVHSTSTIGSSDITDCSCNAGYVFDNPDCVACAAGTYANDGVCVSCGLNAFSSAASDAADDCFCNNTMCQQFVFTNNCVGICADSPEDCVACSAGEFKNFTSGIGNTDECQSCAVDSYQHQTGQTGCLQCHETRTNQHKLRTTVESCECRIGFEPTSELATDTCVACSTGHVKSDHGDFDCVPCDIGQFIDITGASACLHCWQEVNVVGANTTLTSGSTNVDDCLCDEGRYNSNNVCELCASGSYKSAKGMFACTFCGVDPVNHYGADEEGAVSLTHCLSCPDHSGQDKDVIGATNLMDSVSDCLCFPGHDTWTSSACTACEQYEYKIGYSNDECIFCPAGHYFVSSNQLCLMCDLVDGTNTSRRHQLNVVNSADNTYSWGTGESDCTCDVGYVRINDINVDYCQGCDYGTYRNDPLQLGCTDCALDHYQDQIGMTECIICPNNSHTNATAKTAITDCLCNAGYELHDSEHLCIACPAGSFSEKGSNLCQLCPENTFSEGAAETCTPCGANEQSPSASKSQLYCNCMPGYGSNGSATCVACDEGKFSVGGVAQTNQYPVCSDCPTAKTSPSTSDAVNDCVCIPGHEDVGTDASAACTPCVSGQYSHGGSNEPCKICGFGAVTEPTSAAVSFDQCQCDATIGLQSLA